MSSWRPIPESRSTSRSSENEAFKTALADQPPGGRRPRPLPVLGWRWPPRAGRRRTGARHHRRFLRVHRQPNEGAVGLYQVDGVQYGVPFNLGMVGFWYNKDLFAQAGHRRPTGDLGRVPGGCAGPEGRRHHPDGGRCRRQVARPFLLLVSHDPGGRRGGDGRSDGVPRLQHSRVRRGRQPTAATDRHGAIPGRLPGRTMAMSRRRGRGHRHRSSGDEPDGPVGPGRLCRDVGHRHPGGSDRRAAPRRVRLVPLPGG